MAAALTEEARKKANLRLLQRSIDSSIEDIVGSATHVVLYEYAGQAWEKSQVEGSMFLVAQAGKQYSLAILNRHSTENFCVPVTNKFQLQVKEPYLIFKQASKVLGIWFHNPNERIVMASLLNQVIHNLKQAGAAAAAIPAPAPPPQPPVQQALPPTHQHQYQQQPPMAVPVGVAASSSSAAVPQQSTRTAVSPMAQQIPTAPVTREAQANVASPSQLIEPLMNSLFVGTAPAGQPPRQEQSASRSDSGTSTPTRNVPGVALDKKSLQLALLSLIQDERFIDLLHAQYLKVAHARAHRNNKK